MADGPGRPFVGRGKTGTAPRRSREILIDFSRALIDAKRLR